MRIDDPRRPVADGMEDDDQMILDSVANGTRKISKGNLTASIGGGEGTLPSNLSYTDQSNTFSQAQTFSSGINITGDAVSKAPTNGYAMHDFQINGVTKARIGFDGSVNLFKIEINGHTVSINQNGNVSAPFFQGNGSQLTNVSVGNLTSVDLINGNAEDDGDATNNPPLNQVRMQYFDGGGFSHCIRTIHKDGNDFENRIQFFVWNQSAGGSTHDPTLKVFELCGDGSVRLPVIGAGGQDFFGSDATGTVIAKSFGTVNVSQFINDSEYITGMTWTGLTGSQADVNVGSFNNDVGYMTNVTDSPTGMTRGYIYSDGSNLRSLPSVASTLVGFDASGLIATGPGWNGSTLDLGTGWFSSDSGQFTSDGAGSVQMVSLTVTNISCNELDIAGDINCTDGNINVDNNVVVGGHFSASGTPTSDPHTLGVFWADPSDDYRLKMSQG